MRSAYEFLKFSWLLEDEEANFQPGDGDIDRHPQLTRSTPLAMASRRASR